MKILYAVQRTGNGHLARAQDIIPILKKYAKVDVLASGSQAQIKPEFPIRYSYEGLSLFYDKDGALSYLKIFFKNKLVTFIKNVLEVPVKEYDLIINDFEPVTAWACHLRGGNIISLSHQSSLWFTETPQPEKTGTLARFIIRFYAPIKEKYAFHFQSYHPKIFTPVIRKKIRELQPCSGEDYLVYLPAFSNENLARVLKPIEVQWKIFSKYNKKEYQDENCQFIPIDEGVFLKTLESCKGVLCGAGFELPSEALFLNKKLFVIPIKKQLEQEYNAKALELMGIPTSEDLDYEKIESWVKNDAHIKVDYPDNTEEIIRKIINLKTV
jgi:uncharacterized protein (TIGR00661 family)